MCWFYWGCEILNGVWVCKCYGHIPPLFYSDFWKYTPKQPNSHDQKKQYNTNYIGLFVAFGCGVFQLTFVSLHKKVNIIILDFWWIYTKEKITSIGLFFSVFPPHHTPNNHNNHATQRKQSRPPQPNSAIIFSFHPCHLPTYSIIFYSYYITRIYILYISMYI